MESRIPAPEREVDIIQVAVDELAEALPPGWTCRVELEPFSERGKRLDAIIAVSAPDQPPVRLAVEAKRLFVTRDVEQQLAQLSAQFDERDPLLPTLVARYLAPTTRARIAASRGNYLDATGNIRIESTQPPMLLMLSGEDQDPWRGPGRPRGTLKGDPAARVVRALVDYAPPYSVPELVERSGASTGATYRVVKFLEEEGLLEREERGPIYRVAWRPLLERWSQDYGLEQADAPPRAYLEPRGIDVTMERLRDLEPDAYVITSSVAAQLDAPYAPARLLTLYVRDLTIPEEKLRLRPVAMGANVRVAANSDDFPFVRRRIVDGLSYAAPSQVAVDLLSGPGRSTSEAGELLGWMERNEDAWRQ